MFSGKQSGSPKRRRCSSTDRSDEDGSSDCNSKKSCLCCARLGQLHVEPSAVCYCENSEPVDPDHSAANDAARENMATNNTASHETDDDEDQDAADADEGLVHLEEYDLSDESR